MHARYVGRASMVDLTVPDGILDHRGQVEFVRSGRNGRQNTGHDRFDRFDRQDRLTDLTNPDLWKVGPVTSVNRSTGQYQASLIKSNKISSIKEWPVP